MRRSRADVRALMLLIPCPWCGPRNQIEFTYGGDATVRRPAPMRRRRSGPVTSTCATIRWGRTTNGGCTAPGAGNGSGVRRDTRTHDILGSAAPGATLPAAAVTQPFRLPDGGTIDRAQALPFEFDGTRYEGFAGDTLASALIANGVHLVARSFKYHRPRGIFSAGAEEPNALVRLGRGARTEPNVRATTQELYAGLVATSQNCWPSRHVRRRRDQQRRVAVDSGGLLLQDVHVAADAEVVAPLRARDPPRRRHGQGVERARSRPLRAPVRALRRARGGRGPRGPRRRARRGACRCARAPVRRESGVRRQPRRHERATIDDVDAAAWIARRCASLPSHPNVTLLPRTTAFGCYDGNLVGLVERIADHLPAPSEWDPRQRLWKVRARAVVLATGAHERGIAYANNDLPGTLLAGAARSYVERYAVRPGSRAVVFTNNDSAYAAALALHGAGVDIAAIVDPRSGAALEGALAARARAAGLPIIAKSAITGAHGTRHVAAVDVAQLAGGLAQRIECDLVALSGGWNPAVHLHSQARGKLRYDDALATFVPDGSPAPITSAGAANGCFDLAAALAEGHAAGLAAAARAGIGRRATLLDPARALPSRAARCCRYGRPRADKGAKRFVDWQNDVTVDDIALAAREGYRSVEHLKRYTTLGMGTDQGKTSNIVGLALLAEALDVPIAAGGHDDVPASLHARSRSARFRASMRARTSSRRDTRRCTTGTSRTARASSTRGCGSGRTRIRAPAKPPDDAAFREARNVRVNVGVVDVSTLGKIELQGSDVAEFLNRVYINRWDTLAVGRCRYGVMLRDDGIVLDDGTDVALSPTHYLMTTTTVNAVRVLQHLEMLLQADWPELDVRVTSVTEQWAAAALSGPAARARARKGRRHRRVERGISLSRGRRVPRANRHRPGSRAPFPHELLGRARLRNPRARGPRPRDVEGADRRGRPFGIMPYGTEAMSTLRIEKGHIVIGAEADGRTTADDLGIGNLVSDAKDCIGRPLLARAGADGARSLATGGARHASTTRRCRAPQRSSPIPIARRRTRSSAT